MVNLLPIQIKRKPKNKPIKVFSNPIPTNFGDKVPFTNGCMVKAHTISGDTLKNHFPNSLKDSPLQLKQSLF